MIFFSHFFTDKMRPEIPDAWHEDAILNEIVKIMQECWYDNSSSRLTALRIKKSIGSISEAFNSKMLITEKI